MPEEDLHKRLKFLGFASRIGSTVPPDQPFPGGP